jgi:nucleotide-binding universal stress UspA family protein
MAIRDILLHLDGSPPATVRLGLAAALARRHDAHLVGLFVKELPLPMIAGDPSGGAALALVLEALRRDMDAEAERLAAAFAETLRREGLRGEFRAPEGGLAREIALHGRHADLIVLGQAQPEAPGGAAAIEAALFSTGRPVLLVPHAGTPATPGKRVLVGWNGSREASRALHDSLPLIAGAERVVVLTINAEPGGERHGEEPGADIAAHLARHGLKVEVRRVVGADISAGDLLLNEATDMGADLIVMGGYGHSRFREFMLGGVTRSLLGQMTVPVLMAH